MRSEIAVLTETYIAIAATVPQTRIERFDGLLVASGPFAHPLCNFALVLDASQTSKADELGAGRPHFNVYTFESAGTFDVPSHKPVVTMRVMTAKAASPSGQPNTPEDSVPKRLNAAQFMADQFFPTSSPDVRHRIADATARASGTDLFTFGDSSTSDDQPIVGAAMLTRHTPIIGMFNVCVAKNMRGRGFGSAIVRAMLNVAAQSDSDTTLQCDLSLEAWYARLGFKTVDSMTIWTRDYGD